MQLMANNVTEVMSLSSRNPNPRLCIDVPHQEASGVRTFESGSHLQIRLRTMLSSAALSTREQQTGYSGAVFSKSGNLMAHCCGFMASVCHSNSLYHPRSGVTCLFSGIRKKCPLVRSFSCDVSRDLNHASSAVIRDIMTLRDAGLASMAYYYFDFRDTEKQNRRNLILSLLSQLSDRPDLCCYSPSRLCHSQQRRAQAHS